VLRGAGARALEEHVFHKVGDAIDVGSFAAGAGFDPDAHCDGSNLFHALGQYDQAIRQYGTAKITLIDHRLSVGFNCSEAKCKIVRPLSVRTCF
jgi:hypothetical protein